MVDGEREKEEENERLLATFCIRGNILCSFINVLSCQEKIT